jgi:hypothetical protein
MKLLGRWFLTVSLVSLLRGFTAVFSERESFGVFVGQKFAMHVSSPGERLVSKNLLQARQNLRPGDEKFCSKHHRSKKLKVIVFCVLSFRDECGKYNKSISKDK